MKALYFGGLIISSLLVMETNTLSISQDDSENLFLQTSADLALQADEAYFPDKTHPSDKVINVKNDQDFMLYALHRNFKRHDKNQ